MVIRLECQSVNWFRLVAADCGQILYPPGWDCRVLSRRVSFAYCGLRACEPVWLCVLRFCPVCVIWGPCCLWKSIRGSSQVLRNRRSIQKSRQEIDLHDDCEWITVSRRLGRTRTTNLVSKRLCRRRPRVEDAGLVGRVGIERNDYGNLQIVSCRLV